MNILCCKIPFYRLPPNIFFHCFLWFITLFFHDPFHLIFAPTISSLPLFDPLAFDFLPSNPSPLSQPSIFFPFLSLLLLYTISATLFHPSPFPLFLLLYPLFHPLFQHIVCFFLSPVISLFLQLASSPNTPCVSFSPLTIPRLPLLYHSFQLPLHSVCFFLSPYYSQFSPVIFLFLVPPALRVFLSHPLLTL